MTRIEHLQQMIQKTKMFKKRLDSRIAKLSEELEARLEHQANTQPEEVEEQQPVEG